jgi:hypothetical protein
VKGRFAFFGAVVTAIALTACGGGGNAGPFISAFNPTSVTTTASVGGSASTVALPGISNGSANIANSLTIGLPGALAGSGSLSATFEYTRPSGVPVPALSGRYAPDALGGSNLNVIAYVGFDFTTAMTYATSPSFAFSLVNVPAGQPYIVEYTASGWQEVEGPGTVSGNTISFTGVTLTPPVTFAANTPYLFALVTSGTALNTPAPQLNYGFTGTMTQSATYTYPSPSPFPATSSAATITETVSLGSSPAPNASTSVDVHAVSIASGALSSNTTTSDTWIGASSGKLVEYGTQSADSVAPVPDTYSTTYVTPAQIDVLPEAVSQWTNSPAATTTEADSDGTTDSRTYASDGSYSDTQSLPIGLTIAMQDAADGSGVLTGTLFTNYYGLDPGFIFDAPSGGAVEIDLGLPGGPVEFALVPDWLTASLPLYSESDALTTGVTYPASCSVPAVEGKSGNDIHQQIKTVDPILGYTEVRTTDTYTSPYYGPVCIAQGDVQTYYYDYTGDTQASYYNFADFEGVVLSTVTTNQTLTLQTATGNEISTFAKTRSASAGPAALGGMMIPVRGVTAQFDAFLAKNRMQHLKNMRTWVKNYAAHHGGKIAR